jgi:hypothetical protein
MDAFDAYILYLALKRHFAVGSTYDFIKYSGKVTASKVSFDTRNDKYSFHKLSKKDNPKEFVIANMVKFGPNIWIGDLVTDSKYEHAYKDFVKRKESLSYVFKNEIANLDTNLASNFKVVDGQYPKLLELYMKNKVEMQTLIILDSIFGFFDKWNTQIEDTLIWPKIYNTCIKYKPFLEYDKNKLAKLILESIEV